MAPPPEAADGAGQGAGRLCPAGPAARAPTPEGDGSVAGGRRIHLCADGSGHGGRHYFQGPQVPCQQQQQQQQSEGHHSALWVVEDGGPRGGTPPPAGPPPDGSVKDSSGGKGSSFSGAVVMIEEPSDASMFDWGTYWSSLPKKLKGGLDTRLPVPTLRNLFWSWLGAFLGILAVCAMNQWVSPEIDIAFVVGSFGASAVLVFAVLESKMSQPRNFLGGQFLSALVGITTRVVIHQTWIAGPVGMSLALLVMQVTATTHPPGGATALIAATLPTLPKWHGYSYLVTIAVGSVIMQLIALLVNNLDPKRRYPTYWW